ncbi:MULTISPECIES: MFS transporter [unclassified Streptomyces]|uniref:MFS transporter n=1 Tax=unclassified Streptomyces TaxID=2593676 RepID=UPI002DD80F76|nr:MULTISPECIES: MFS transporter [unclassified Streptomyces]WSA94697.1 MFS transporter [Streptomyces sp. NBC_01795]WSB79116.1 MFS transporter [Streptomyces sp. NBC_01775]WSS12682.1 MFS transporter [Streptomyces sp. NBC_01186]WSS41466.1 MFS transporter [Streptomyces sp. NBC_01187]
MEETVTDTGRAGARYCPEEEGTPGERWVLLGVLLSGQFLANVDVAIVNTAAPSIHQRLGATDAQVALVVSSYVIAFAVLLITGARLGAVHGQRRMFLWGLGVFTAASLACGLAPGPATLVVARVVQGVGAALMVPQVLSGIQTHFPGPEQRARALGYYALALSGGAVAGQFLGGVLISADLWGSGWRPIFLINVPLGLLLVLATLRWMPRDVRTAEGPQLGELDLRGVGLLSVGVLLVIVPLVLGGDAGWPWWAWVCLGAGGPVLAGFALYQSRLAARGGRPLVAPAVVATRSVRWGLVAFGLTVSTYFALLFVLALYLQQGLGKSPEYSGMAMLTWVAAFGLAGPVLPRVPERLRRMVPVVGCLLLAAGYAGVWAYLLAGQRSGPLLFLLLAPGGLGLGLGNNALIAHMTSAVPGRYAADLSGVISTNGQISGALGVAALGSWYLALASGGAAAAAHALQWVVAGFAALALCAAVAALRATGTTAEEGHVRTGTLGEMT